MENQLKYAEKIKGQSKDKEKTEAAVVSSKAKFFQKLEAAKNDPIKERVYEGTSVAYHMELNKNREDYERRRELYLKEFGYEPHVTKAMVYAYGGEHNVNAALHKGDLTCEYASMIASQKAKEAGVKEPAIETANDCIKRALCFQALKKAEGKELTAEKVAELGGAAAVLAKYISKENTHVLRNKELMLEALSVIDGRKEGAKLSEINASRIVCLDRRDSLNEEKLRQDQKTQELSRFNNKGKDFEIGV